MEIIIAVFIGLWLSFFAIWAYRRLKKEYRDILNAEQKGTKEK